MINRNDIKKRFLIGYADGGKMDKRMERRMSWMLLMVSAMWGSSFVASKICMNGGMQEMETVFSIVLCINGSVGSGKGSCHAIGAGSEYCHRAVCGSGPAAEHGVLKEQGGCGGCLSECVSEICPPSEGL